MLVEIGFLLLLLKLCILSFLVVCYGEPAYPEAHLVHDIEYVEEQKRRKSRRRETASTPEMDDRSSRTASQPRGDPNIFTCHSNTFIHSLTYSYPHLPPVDESDPPPPPPFRPCSRISPPSRPNPLIKHGPHHRRLSRRISRSTRSTSRSRHDSL